MRRRESQVGAGPGGVGEGVAHVALLRHFTPNIESFAGQSADQVQHLVDRHPAATADVIDGAGPAPVAGRHRRRRDVPGEGEVAGLFAVAVEGDRLSGERGPDEAVKPHVRALPRTVHGEVAKRDRRHAVVDVIEVTEVLGRQLGHAVRRDGLEERILAHRNRRDVSVHRRARRVDEAVQAPLLDGLEQPLRRVDVVGRVDAEVLAPALADPRLRGEMEHGRHAVEQHVERRGLNGVVDEAKCRPGQQRLEVAFLDARARSSR